MSSGVTVSIKARREPMVTPFVRCLASLSALGCQGYVDELELADLDFIPIVQSRRFNPGLVNVRAVEAPGVSNMECSANAGHDCMSPRNGYIVEKNITRRVPPDRDLIAIECDSASSLGALADNKHAEGPFWEINGRIVVIVY